MQRQRKHTDIQADRQGKRKQIQRKKQADRQIDTWTETDRKGQNRQRQRDKSPIFHIIYFAFICEKKEKERMKGKKVTERLILT